MACNTANSQNPAKPFSHASATVVAVHSGCIIGKTFHPYSLLTGITPATQLKNYNMCSFQCGTISQSNSLN
jgi:hypothetical protein